MCSSMLITPSMHFHPRIFQHFIMQYPRLKPFTRRGCPSKIFSVLRCTSCRMWKDWWVLWKNNEVSRIHPVNEYEFLSGIVYQQCYWYTSVLVLNPKEKMGYFKKHWPAELQEEVRTCIEEEVHPSSLLLFQDLIAPSSKNSGYGWIAVPWQHHQYHQWRARGFMCCFENLAMM